MDYTEYPEMMFDDVQDNNDDDSSDEDPYDMFIRLYDDFLQNYVFYDPIHAAMYFGSASYVYVYDSLISCIRKYQQRHHSLKVINDHNDNEPIRVLNNEADYFNVLKMFLPLLSPIEITIDRDLVRYFKSLMAMSGRELKKRNVIVPPCPTKK